MSFPSSSFLAALLALTSVACRRSSVAVPMAARSVSAFSLAQSCITKQSEARQRR